LVEKLVINSAVRINEPPPAVSGENEPKSPSSYPAIERRCHGDLSWDYLPVRLSSDSAGLVADFRSQILPRVRPEWTAAASGGRVRHRVFEDGLTNKLVGFFRDGEPESTAVLVRVNGKGREMVIVDARMEILVMTTLHRAGLSPPLYLVTENAMCYGYVPGKTFTASDLQREDVLVATSCALARFHSVPLPTALRDSAPRVWALVDSWMDCASDNFRSKSDAERFRQVFVSLDDLRQELVWLKLFLGAPLPGDKVTVCARRSDWGFTSLGDGRGKACDSPCVLCHNDVQPLNFVQTGDGI
jgi:thiamine kinase-like enzyme